jgi:hypothetical protein
MHISQESPEQTEKRLRSVLAEAEFELQAGEYAFVECVASEFPMHLTSDALAFVKDAQVWSALTKSSDARAERFLVFSFHFHEGQDGNPPNNHRNQK